MHSATVNFTFRIPLPLSPPPKTPPVLFIRWCSVAHMSTMAWSP